MLFSMKHKFFHTTKEFTETTAPKWLTSENTIRGSTMDERWFWDLILKLEVGKTIQTDFQIIERVE